MTPRGVVLIRLFCWLGFVVVVGLLPLAADLVNVGLHGHGYDIDKVLAGGALFIISAVIGGAVMGEAVTAGAIGLLRRYGPWRIIVVSVLAAGHFALATVNTGAYMEASTACPNEVVRLSKWLFALTVISAVPVLLITGREPE